MQTDWFSNIIDKDKVTFTDGRWISLSIDPSPSWSFSDEWKEHADTGQQRTWDKTAAQRLDDFYSETKTSQQELLNKIVLDAGCGNGQLTRAISEAGAYAVGIDRQPHLPAGDVQLQFVQCDFDNPPLHPSVFDIIIANGSIHHTKNSFHSFRSLTSLTREKGKLYVWVYKKQKGWQGFLVWWLDIARFFISRMPSPLQRVSVNVLTTIFYFISRIRKGENSNRTKDELRINIYDAFTPRYRHYHTPAEVNGWFVECGFEEAIITHDNNRYGFGMLGVKKSVVQPAVGSPQLYY
jgi:SAM-dependent methyltransferase